VKILRKGGRDAGLMRRLQRIEAEQAALRRREREIRRLLEGAGQPVPSSRRAEPAEPRRQEERPGETGELFSWRQERREQASAAVEEPDAAGAKDRAGRFRFDDRVAAYLATGAFAAETPGGASASARRNRIIIVLGIVLVSAFVLYHLLRP